MLLLPRMGAARQGKVQAAQQSDLGPFSVSPLSLLVGSLQKIGNGDHMTAGCCDCCKCELVAKSPDCDHVTMGTLNINCKCPFIVPL